MTIIGTKWIFRNKLDKNGVVSRNKARLVAQGYNQQEGIDYDETYTSVARVESIRILLAYACALDFKLFQMDVKSVFLNGFMNEEGVCAFTDRWSLDELAYGVPSDGLYQTNPPSPDDIILSIRIDREGQVRRICHEEEIDVQEYQVLTREIEPTLKPLEEIIQENVFCLGSIHSHSRGYRLYVVLDSSFYRTQGFKNGVPRMKGLLSSSFMSKITKSTRPSIDEFHISRVGHDVYIIMDEHIDPNPDTKPEPYRFRAEMVPNLAPFFVSASFTDTSISGPSISLLSSSVATSYMSFFFLFSDERDGIYAFGDRGFGLFSNQNFFRGLTGCKFIKKPEHFSHPTIDLLALHENGIFKSLYSFKSEVLNDFLRFIGILIAEFAAAGVVNFALKMKRDMIIKNLDLKPMIDAMMRDFL
nr:copia protein [Tanacetum cinerariifolium]